MSALAHLSLLGILGRLPLFAGVLKYLPFGDTLGPFSLVGLLKRMLFCGCFGAPLYLVGLLQHLFRVATLGHLSYAGCDQRRCGS